MNPFATKVQGLVLLIILVILSVIGSMAEERDFKYCIESLDQDDRLDLFHWRVCNHAPTQGRALPNPIAPRRKKRSKRRYMADNDIEIPRKVYSNRRINKEEFWKDLQECCLDRAERCFYLLTKWEIVGCEPWEDWTDRTMIPL